MFVIIDYRNMHNGKETLIEFLPSELFLFLNYFIMLWIVTVLLVFRRVLSEIFEYIY